MNFEGEIEKFVKFNKKMIKNIKIRFRSIIPRKKKRKFWIILRKSII